MNLKPKDLPLSSFNSCEVTKPMNLARTAIAASIALASLSISLSAFADTVTARCDVFPKGDDKATYSGLCTFSQRQGFVDIQLSDGNGKQYNLTPDSNQTDTYTDQNGKPATREVDDKSQVYRLATESIFVYWDTAPYDQQQAPNATLENNPVTAQNNGAKTQSFNSVCGVIQDKKTYRYLCKVEDVYVNEERTKTILRYPDNTFEIIWGQGNSLTLNSEGIKPIPGTYSTSEGETDIVTAEKTWLYISDPNAAKMEVQNFKP